MPACSTSGRTPSSRRCCSSPSAGPVSAAGSTAAKALRGSALAAPLLRVSFLFGLLSLAGVPLVVGGLSKEHVVAVAWEGAGESGPGVVVLVALLVTAAVTAAYCTRAYLLLTAHVAPGAGRRAGHPGGPGGARGARRAQRARRARAADRRASGSARPRWSGRRHRARHRRRRVAVALRGGFDRDPAEVLAAGSSRTPTAGWASTRSTCASWPRPVLRLARLVAFLDTEVIDAYVRGTAVAHPSRRMGGRPRLPR